MGCCKSKNTRNCKPKGKLYEIVSCTPCSYPQPALPPPPQPLPLQHTILPMPQPQPIPQQAQIQMIPIPQQLSFNSQIQFSRQPTSIIYTQPQPQFFKSPITIPLPTTTPLIQPQQPIQHQQIQVPHITHIAQPQFIPQPQYQQVAYHSIPQYSGCCPKQQQPIQQCVQPICTLVLKPYKQDKCAKKAAKKCAKQAKKNNKCFKC